MSVFDDVETINALVVGANRGIGFGLVWHLLQKGIGLEGERRRVDRVYATYRQEATAALGELALQNPDRLYLLPMDITDETQIAEGIAHIKKQIDRLHLVVYCVGLLHDDSIQPEKSLQQINSEHLLRYFQINSIGAVLLAQHLSPLLKHSDRSVFASISAKVGSIGDNHLGGWYGYRASKAALNMFMRTVAIEYSRKTPKTIVVMLHPGTTDTQLSKPFQRNVAPDKLFSVDRTVTQLLAVIHQLKPEDSGEFFSWDGNRLPW